MVDKEILEAITKIEERIKKLPKGYISKKALPSDNRELIISLTKKALELKKEAYEIPPQISKEVKLTKEEAQELYRLLYKVLEGFKDE